MSVFGDGGLAEWLRRLIESGLGEWREREAHFLAVREREGDYHYFEARERVAQLEAELAILDACLPDASVEAALDNGDISTEEYVASEAAGSRVVRLLASGYRHRPGYREEWKP